MKNIYNTLNGNLSTDAHTACFCLSNKKDQTTWIEYFFSSFFLFLFIYVALYIFSPKYRGCFWCIQQFFVGGAVVHYNDADRFKIYTGNFKAENKRNNGNAERLYGQIDESFGHAIENDTIILFLFIHISIIPMFHYGFTKKISIFECILSILFLL